uniref:SFRICE_016620 n=1 Tax=Spodoptera frugiperda TaxID=7108 RepID=A0A2H1VCD9_SPOFR
MKVCACVLLFTIFALIKASSQHTIKDQILKQAADDKLQNEDRTRDVTRDLPAKPKALGKVPRFQVTTPRVVTFTEFLQQAIRILNTYDDTTFGDFIDILNEEVKNHHYKGCKFSDLTKHHDTRRLLQTKLDLISGKPVSETKANVNALADMLRDERYDRKAKDFVDFINSLYGAATVEKFEKILNELEHYNKPGSRRMDDNLAQLVKDALKTLIFDYYTKLHVNAKIELKEKIQEIWNQMQERQTSGFNKHNFRVTPPTTKYDTSENMIPAPVPPAEDKDSSYDADEGTSGDARAKKTVRIASSMDSEYVLDSSSNSINEFQEKLRQFNTQRYVTLVTEAYGEVHSDEDGTDEANRIGTNNEARHKNKQTSGENKKKYVKGLARYAMKHLNNHDINKVYQMATKDRKKYREEKKEDSIEESRQVSVRDKYYEVKNNRGGDKRVTGMDTFGYKRALPLDQWRGGRYKQIYRRGGSLNTTTTQTNDLVRRVSNLEVQLQEVKEEIHDGHTTNRHSNTQSVTTRAMYDTKNKINKTRAVPTIQMRADANEFITEATNNKTEEVTATVPSVATTDKVVHVDTNTRTTEVHVDTNTRTTEVHSPVTVAEVSEADTRLYDIDNATAVYDKTNASMSTSGSLRRHNSPITHAAADYTYIELDPFDHILSTAKNKRQSSSAYSSPLLDIGLPNCSPLCSITSDSHPAPASHPAQIVTPPRLGASYTTFTETRSPLQDSLTPTVVGPAANMAGPLPLQLADPVGYVDHLGSLPNHFVSNAIPERDTEHSPFHSPLSDFEFVDQSSRKCPRFGTVCHYG